MSFWFFPNKGFRLVFLNRVRVRVSFCFRVRLGLGFRFEFGFGKLIGGAVGTVGWGSRKPPVIRHIDLIAYLLFA